MSRFRDNLSLAESRAISRALSSLGYGASFRYESEPVIAEERPVVQPVDFASTKGRRITQSKLESTPASPLRQLQQPATARQLLFIHAIARESGLSEKDLTNEASETFGEEDLSKLNRNDAARFIDRLQSRLQSMLIAS
jgi:hypothetical protein